MRGEWFVVQTKPKKEREAQNHLERQGFETRLPLLRRSVRRRGRWREAIEPLFPRYLFICLTLGADNIAPIRSTRGVIDLVRFGGDPVPLPAGFVEELDAKAANPSGVHEPEQLTFEPGDLVVIMEGPFAGTVGRFEAESGESRVLLLLELLGRSSRVSVRRDLVGRAD